jgi:glycerol-3-phosphate dehydrogenase (NAD(P)+)
MGTRISVIGGGSWGTAIALIMAEKGFPVRLWVFEEGLPEMINTGRENRLFLPGVELPGGITATRSLDEAARDADLILFVVPSHVARTVLSRLGPSIPDNTPLVILTKGIENESLFLMSDVAEQVLPPSRAAGLAVLSGPSFAKETVLHHPTAVVLASRNRSVAARAQEIINTPHFKVFTSADMVGVQLGGALKNVIALAAGGADGLGFGTNTRAALITRGLTEIIRLGRVMGADPKTFSGLSGLGDLILTCTGELSRNRTVGFQIGQGRKLKDILREMKMVAEGVHTTRAASQLARKHGVRMPIVEQIHAVLFEEKDPRLAVTDLMESAAGDELDVGE